MVTDYPVQGILERLVGRIVDMMPITAAGVMVISETTGPRYVAASDEAALRYVQLQTDLGEVKVRAWLRTEPGKPLPSVISRTIMNGSRSSGPERSTLGWLRCSPSLCARAPGSLVRSICAARRRVRWTTTRWRRHRPWRT